MKQISARKYLYVSPLLPYCKSSFEGEEANTLNPWKPKNGALHWKEEKQVEERTQLTIRGACSIKPLHATPIGRNHLQSQKRKRYRPHQVK